MFICCAPGRMDREMRRNLTSTGSVPGLRNGPPANTDNLPLYKVVVLGDGGVGKSALTIQYFQKSFIEEYDPTIEDSYIQTMNIDGQWCVMDVLDTAGQEEYSAMRDQYIRKGDGFLLVYSVTDHSSFLAARLLHTQILRVKDCDSYPMLLVANKIDLEGMRVVSEDMGRQLARELNLPYVETSCKPPPINVDLTFTEIIREIRAQPQELNEAEKRRLKSSNSRRRGNRCRNGRKHCTIL